MGEQRTGGNSESRRARVVLVTAGLGAGLVLLAAGLFFKLRVEALGARFAKEQQLPDTAKVVSMSWRRGKTGILLLSATIQLSRADGDLFCSNSGAGLVETRPEGTHRWSDMVGQQVSWGPGETARTVTVRYAQGMDRPHWGASLQIEGFSSIPISPSNWWAGPGRTRPRRRQVVRYRLTAPTLKVPAAPPTLASRSP